MLIVQKFGGSSLAGLDKLRRAAGICADARRRGHDVAVVVSAMGSSTDELLDLAHRISDTPDPRELDALLSCGERQSAALMAIMLDSLGVEARSFSGWQAGIFTDRFHGDAEINLVAPGRIRSALEAGCTAVVSGFQGINAAGDITTLGRGGSDTTAVALSASLGADSCEIYTDVDGIYTADPRLVTGAKLIDEIDYNDMLRLALGGSQVLHSRSVELAMRSGVEIHLLSSFSPGRGSVVKALSPEQRPDTAGITKNSVLSELCVVGKKADAGLLSRLVIYLGSKGLEIKSGRIMQEAVALGAEKAELVKIMQAAHSFLFP